ncbi:MAG: chalcone isomerase family protein [Granulosicoccus sp.]
MKSNLKVALSMVLFCALSMPAQATPQVIKTHLADPELVGEARLKVMFWNVFDASLYAESGHYQENQPFALSLTYLRSLEGKKIVDKSMEEIRRQSPDTSDGQLVRWEQKLLEIIPDVSKGTSITGVRTPEGHTRFYFGNEPIGSVQDSTFTHAFFSIWLSSEASDPKFRHKLLGGNKDI